MHVIGTAGHVDHGKSALVERLTGIDPDRFEEEKRRGLTIDLGFAWLELPSGHEIGIIDVPGHERFIRNMLAGAGGISVCMFVVAANEGWMPQSAEHLAVLDILGVDSGVVALTKSDTVDEETLEIAREEVRENLTGSSLDGIPIVACSAITGDGLDDLITELDRAVSTAQPISDIGRPRLWIDRVFTISGAGTVVTGTLLGGQLATGVEIEVAPARRRGRVRSIQSHKKVVDTVGPGNRVALNLAGLERAGTERGDAVVLPEQWRPASRIDAQVHVLDAAAMQARRSSSNPLRRSTRARSREGGGYVLLEKGAHLLYLGSAETPVRIKLLDADDLAPGTTGLAQLYLRDPLPLARGDRFVLRDAGRELTLGGGIVLDPLAPKSSRNDERRLRTLERLVGASSESALVALVEGEEQLGDADAAIRTGYTRSETPHGVVRLDHILVSRKKQDELSLTIRRTLASHHHSQPLERGMAKELLRTDVALEAGSFEALLKEMPDVVEERAFVRLESHSVALAPDQEALRDELVSLIERHGFAPPPAKDLSTSVSLLKALTDSGELTRIGDFYLTARQATDARSRIRQHIEANGPVTMADLRDLFGTTRKYAVPLAEWLDATGATQRRGDVRVLGPTP
ncbi:MAG: selenocysteine-specific translation elongation factor [Actinobacteria bacterium]|nr:selenocysteine-specific translation elongation factor [Actinomycetota bacterium]